MVPKHQLIVPSTLLALATKIRTYKVTKPQRCNTLTPLTYELFFQNSSKRRVLRASKRDLEREISTTVDPDWIFFLAEVSKYNQAAEAFFLAYRLIKSSRELSIHSIITVIHFSTAIKLCKCFYKIISRNYELRKFWSVNYSSCFDFRYFPSHSTTPRIKLSCKSVNWQYAVISGPAVT